MYCVSRIISIACLTNNVPRGMLSCKYGLLHKPNVAGSCQFRLQLPRMREKVLVHRSQPQGYNAFLGHGEAQANNIFCLETKEHGHRNIWNPENCRNKLNLAHVFLNVLKDSKRDARTLNTIKQWSATSCPKSRNFCKVHKLVARDHQMTLKLMINCTLPRWFEGEADGYKLVWQSHTTANSADNEVLPGELQHGSDYRPTSCTWPWASWIFFLFLKVKTALNRRYSNTRNIWKNILAKLDAVPLDIFNDLFTQLFEIQKKYVTVKGV